MGGIPELVWEVYSYGSIILCLRTRTRGPCWGHGSVLWTRAMSSRVPWDGFVGCRFGKEGWLGEPPALCLSAAQLLILAAINHRPAPSLEAAAAWFC